MRVIDSSKFIQLTTLWFVVLIYQQTAPKTPGIVDTLRAILPWNSILGGISVVLVLVIPVYVLSEILTSQLDV